MNIWNFIEGKLNEKKPIYLMAVIDSKGSSPGKQGFSMAVCGDGDLHGSIGGGSMEFNLVEDCKKMLSNKEYRIFIKKQVHKGNASEGSGMVCSGEQTVAFIPLTPSDFQNVVSITSCLSNKETGVLELSERGYNFSLSDENPEIQYQCSITNEKKWKFSKVIGYRNTIYIIGAGHVGFAVSKLFSQLGFKVVLFDNRPNLGMLTDNLFADEKFVIDYKKVGDYIPESIKSYVVIMTNNHTHDKEVLSMVLRKKVAYLGLMGSKQKVAGLLNAMKKDSFTDDELNQLHAPIGISINSKTSDEIAVSIAAEVISIKNSV